MTHNHNLVQAMKFTIDIIYSSNIRIYSVASRAQGKYLGMNDIIHYNYN